MSPEDRTTARSRILLAMVGCDEFEQDSTLPGRVRLRAAEIKKHLRLAAAVIPPAEEIERTPNAHLGAVEP